MTWTEIFSEDDLRLAFEAGRAFGMQEEYEGEGHYRVPDAQRAPDWEQYLETVRALRAAKEPA